MATGEKHLPWVSWGDWSYIHRQTWTVIRFWWYCTWLWLFQVICINTILIYMGLIKYILPHNSYICKNKVPPLSRLFRPAVEGHIPKHRHPRGNSHRGTSCQLARPVIAHSSGALSQLKLVPIYRPTKGRMNSWMSYASHTCARDGTRASGLEY